MALAAVEIYFRWFRPRGPEVARAVETVAIDRLHDVLFPDGMGGHIQLEHLLLTGSGLLVIDVKAYEGIVFAGERMEEWTVMGDGGRGRFTFANPLETLFDRVAAVRQIARDLPVEGYVLFASGAKFNKGRPRQVVLPGELIERHRPPERAELERLMEAFAPHWEHVKSASEPVK
jgi:hypothetical protein